MTETKAISDEDIQRCYWERPPHDDDPGEANEPPTFARLLLALAAERAAVISDPICNGIGTDCGLGQEHRIAAEIRRVLVRNQ